MGAPDMMAVMVTDSRWLDLGSIWEGRPLRFGKAISIERCPRSRSPQLIPPFSIMRADFSSRVCELNCTNASFQVRVGCGRRNMDEAGNETMTSSST